MKALVLFSGGVDSSTCLALAVQKYGAENVVALSVSYGQKHTKEISAADAVAGFYCTEHIKLDLSTIFQVQRLFSFGTVKRGNSSRKLRRAA